MGGYLQTIELVAELLPDDIGVSVSYPMPGTKFYDMVKLDLEDTSNWTDSGDLAMVFAGTYSTAFYRELHHALHDDLDLRRREAGLSRARHPQIDEVRHRPPAPSRCRPLVGAARARAGRAQPQADPPAHPHHGGDGRRRAELIRRRR